MGVSLPRKGEGNAVIWEVTLFTSDYNFLQYDLANVKVDYRKMTFVLVEEQFMLRGVPQFVTTQFRLH